MGPRRRPPRSGQPRQVPVALAVTATHAPCARCRPLAQRRLRDAARRRPLRPAPWRECNHVSRALSPPSWRPPLVCGSRVALVQSSRVYWIGLRDNGAATMPRFPSLERGPAFWLALKSNPHGRGATVREGRAPGLAKWWGVLFVLPLPEMAPMTEPAGSDADGREYCLRPRTNRPLHLPTRPAGGARGRVGGRPEGRWCCRPRGSCGGAGALARNRRIPDWCRPQPTVVGRASSDRQRGPVLAGIQARPFRSAPASAGLTASTPAACTVLTLCMLWSTNCA